MHKLWLFKLRQARTKRLCADTKSQKKDDSDSLENLLKDLDVRFEAVPGPEDLPRKQRRNQHTSRAYHRAQDFLVRQGFSKEVAQEEARRQSRKTGARFDERWPLGSEVVLKKPAVKTSATK